MNWPVLLSMILIFIVGIMTYRSGRVTESIIITLVLLMIFYIVYGHYYYSSEGFADSEPVDTTVKQEQPAIPEIKLTYKQKTAEIISKLMDEKYKKEWMMRIFKRIEDTKPNMENPNDNLPQIVYNASLIEKPLFDAIVKENNIRDMTFDEFFIAMVEIFIENNKNPKSPFYKFTTKAEPLFQSWKVKHLAAVSAEPSAPAAAPATTPATAESSTKVLPELNKLLEVLKPASTTTVVPNANAAQIGTVVKTSPGLEQGSQYVAVKDTRTFPQPGPRCPQPAPQSHCACQKPIMPDGKPFDPNMYIRKDSIPCWNCQLPI